MVQSLPQSDAFRILFNSPELSEVQRSGFHLFLKKGIAEELSKISRIQLKHTQFLIEIGIDAQNFRLVAPENSYRDCILKMKSYTCKLYVETRILFKDKVSGELLYQTQPEWVLLADLPMMTKRGHFVINGSPRVIVHQVGRAPGVYFKKVLKVKKDVNNKARFYGDIIPRKGVWVRLQINKKGDIDLKLKKSKKVRAEMVQKCLELLEKERSKPALLKRHRVADALNGKNQSSVPISGYRFNDDVQEPSLEIQKHLGLLKGDVLSPSERTRKQGFDVDFVCPSSWKKDPFYSGNVYRKLTFTREPLFFSPQSLSLAGINTNNFFYTKTRQTRAFVIGLSINKPQTAVRSIWYHAMPWLKAFTKTPTRTRMLSRFQRTFNPNRCILKEAVEPKFTLLRTNKHQLIPKLGDACLQNFTCKNSVFTTPARTTLSRSRAKNEGTAKLMLMQNKANRLQNFQLMRCKSKICISYANAKRSLATQRIRFATRANQRFASNVKTELCKHAPHAKPRFAVQCIARVNHNFASLGSKIYGKKRSGFTKAEKEAFTNVYTTFYKNDIQDIKERVSISFGGEVQDSTKPDLLNENLSLLSKISTQSNGKPIKKVSKKKITKKQNVNSNLEKVRDYLYQLFKRPDLYDLGAVGREKINTKFGISVVESQLTSLDIKETINWLSKLRAGREEIDDIDHSQNRRVRTSSELIQAQFEIGITRLRTVITKKIRNGRIEQIRTLPCLRTNQLQRVENRLARTTSFDRVHFRGGCSCFVKHNTLINTAQNTLKDRTTFTSINPYCITHKRKQKYYSAFPEARVKPKVLQHQRVASKRFNLDNGKFCSRQDEGMLKRGYTTRIYKGIPCIYRNTFFTDNEIRTNVSVDVAAQDVLHAQSNQLFNLSVSELFSTKPINGALREFFSSSPLSQYMDQTNPLAEITHKRRISSLGVGGVSRESAGMAIRGIHPTHYGRICPIETPEGKNAGLVNSLAFYAKINNQGFIETPYYQVTKGQIQHELGFSFVSAGQESQNGLYIAPNDIKQSKSKLLATNISSSESVPVRVADNILDLFKKVSPYQVDCIGISPVQILSVATSLIPFLEHNDANRALMGSNMQRQAVSLMVSERPLVGTGLEARVLAESGHLVQSNVSGFVSSVSAHKVVVEHLSHNLTLDSRLAPSSDLMHFQQPFYNSSDSGLSQCINPVSRKSHTNRNQATLYKNRSKANWLPLPAFLETGVFQRSLCVPLQNEVMQSIANAKLRFATHYPRFALQLPLTSVKAKQWSVKEPSINQIKPPSYLSMFSHEQDNDGIETLVASIQSSKYRAFCFTKNKFGLLPVTHSISTFSRSNQETCLVQKPLVEEGDWVQKGDMLSDCSAGQKGELSVGKNMLIAYIPWQGYNFEDAIVISDRLVKEQLYTSLHIERYTVVVNDFKDKVVDTNEWFTGNLPGVDSKKRNHLQKSGLPVIGTILKEGDILVGKIKYSKKKPATPHEKLVSDILGEHNFSVQNSSLYVPKGVHEARVLTYKIKKRFEKGLKNKLRPAGAPKVVHIFLGEKRNIQVGDKMSGRHGNKGIVSTILPKQDMPYLADGSPIDILLNPLGVPSRMNVGQVFECLLGLASTYLHQNFKITPFDELYGVEASQSLVFLKLYQARLQSGQNWLFQVNFPGKVRLTDGRSGECLDQWITVGRAYMLKLIHMVNEKIHARAIGPYALVTQQPLKGRAHKGGQRLGEMEVWAVEGFGAAYILQELLTKKSDDSIGRKQVLKAMLPRSASFLDSFDPFGQSVQTETRLGLDNISKKESGLHNESEAFNVLGQPDIFKVLICELQALCLDVGVYSMRTESFQRKFLGILE